MKTSPDKINLSPKEIINYAEGQKEHLTQKQQFTILQEFKKSLIENPLPGETEETKDEMFEDYKEHLKNGELNIFGEDHGITSITSDNLSDNDNKDKEE